MANCPNCNSKISNWKLLSLKPDRNLINCSKCGKIVKSELDYIFHKTKAIGMIGISFLIFAKPLKETNFILSLILAVAGVIAIIFTISSYLRNIRFVIVDTEIKSVEEIYDNKKIEKDSFYFKNEVEGFKKQYSNKSIEELEIIKSEKGWQKSAKKAAEELLKIKKDT